MTTMRKDAYGRWVPAGLAARQTDFAELPVVDFAAMFDGDEAARREVAAQLRRACTEVGFFYLKNHRVPQDLIDRMFGESDRFFAEPIEEKMKIERAATPGFGGYSPMEELGLKAVGSGSLMEGFNMNIELPADDPDVIAGKPFYNPNSWPAEPAEFRPTVLEYYDAMVTLGKKLFEAFAMAIDLPADYFDDMIRKPIALMRINHYPNQEVVLDEKHIGTGAHTDYECFTILAQQPGITALQVVNGNGEWISAPPIPGTFVINIGDQMAHWTNDQFVSTMHRVVNRSGRDRKSCAFFYGTDFDVEMNALPNCIADGQTAKYQPIRAGDYIVGRISDAYGEDIGAKATAAG